MPTKSKIGTGYKELIWLGLSLLAFYVIVPQIGEFEHSWHKIAYPQWGFVGLSALTIVITYVLAALIFLCLSKKPLKLIEEIIIQVAANFVNRLLPAGIGGIGANIQYLRHEGYKPAEAASIATTNNLLGVLAHLIVVIMALLIATTRGLPKLNLSATDVYIVLVVILGGIITLITFYKNRRAQTLRVLTQMKKQLMFYADNPWKLILAVVCHMLLTAMNVLALYFAAWAVGFELHLVPALIIFTFGSAVRNFTPTPGGIGGFEASLVAGLAAYGAGSSVALAGVLLYRLISYWLPLIISSFTFLYVSNKKLLEA